MNKSAIVVHSGGMDSSICLAIAKDTYGSEHVLSLSFDYHQRARSELAQAKKIAMDWNIDHQIISVNSLTQITNNALMDSRQIITSSINSIPNTWVTGRNGLFARLAAIYAHHIGVHQVYLGVIESADSNSGYPDCSAHYIQQLEDVLRIDLMDPSFQLVTPLIDKTKLDTLEIAQEIGVLTYLLDNTVSCYEGIRHDGCRQCPACELRNNSLTQFHMKHPDISFPYPL